MTTRLLLDNQPHLLELKARHPVITICIDGRTREVEVLLGSGDRHAIAIDGVRLDYAIAIDDAVAHIRMAGRTMRIELVDPRDAIRAQGKGSNEVRAPMPGVVVAVHTAAQATVTRGQLLLTIESMKLQMELSAPRDGTIASIAKGREETFDKDDVLVTLQPESGTPFDAPNPIQS